VPAQRPLKSRFVGIRMSTEDAEALEREAINCGLPLSELIRRRIAGRAITGQRDEEFALSMERIARTLRHLCPTEDTRITAEDRARWWSLASELEHIVKVLRRPNGRLGC
jgi:hypothetical protein